MKILKVLAVLAIFVGLSATAKATASTQQMQNPPIITVTVCNSGCIFNSLQSAFNFITGTDSRPAEIHVLSNLSEDRAKVTHNASIQPNSKVTLKCFGNSLSATSGNHLIELNGGNSNQLFVLDKCSLALPHSTALKINGDLGVEILNSKFENSTFGVTFSAGSANPGSTRIDGNNFSNAISIVSVRNMDVTNNVFKSSLPIYTSNNSYIMPSLVRFNNNTVVDASAVVTVFGETHIQLENNIFSNTTTIVEDRHPESRTCTANLNNNITHKVRNIRLNCVGSERNNINSDPLFIDRDLKVSLNSPAINMGIITFVRIDKDGFCRTNTSANMPDAGAYEMNSPCRAQ